MQLPIDITFIFSLDGWIWNMVEVFFYISLYFYFQIFLRELISNSSDALDKIRFLSLTDKNALSATEEMSIKIKVGVGDAQSFLLFSQQVVLISVHFNYNNLFMTR